MKIKIGPNPLHLCRWMKPEILLKMKLTVASLLIFLIQAHADVRSQNINYSAKNAPIEKAFEAIKKQAGYLFFYRNDDIEKASSVTVKLKNADINTALKAVFNGQPLTYSIKGNTVVVSYQQVKTTSIVPAITVAPPLPKPVEIIVKGYVHNENGEPVIVTVTIKGTKTATSTDENGEFTLNFVDPHATLVITGIGIEPKEVKLTGKSYIEVEVKTLIKEATEIVVSTGYQKVSKAKMTGSAVTMSGAEYDQRVAVTGNFFESLQGKIPGLLYNKNTKELSIRGVATLNAVKTPLIVVDGFPMEINIKNLNPNDVVSVSVLKDAAATSIYGARASNGVIVVETRRGHSGDAVFNFRYTVGLQKAPQLSSMNYIQAKDYVWLEKDYALTIYDQINQYASDGAPLTPVQQAVNLFKRKRITAGRMDSLIAEAGSYDNLEEVQRLMYKDRLMQNIDFNVSGGSDKHTYLLGLNYTGEAGYEKAFSDKKLLVNFAMTNKFTNWLKFDFKGSYGYYDQKGSNGYLRYKNDFLPYDRLADSAGNALPVILGPELNNNAGITKTRNNTLLGLGLYDMMYYPYKEIEANAYRRKENSYRLQGRLDAKIAPWLSYEIGGAYESQPYENKALLTPDAILVRSLLNYTAEGDAKGPASFSLIPRGSILKRTQGTTEDYTVRSQFNINASDKEFNHSLTAILGGEIRKTVGSTNIGSLFGYDNQSMVSMPVSQKELITVPRLNGVYRDRLPVSAAPVLNFREFYLDTLGDRRFVSTYANLSYLLYHKYALTGSYRYDQANLFSSKFNGNTFYSVGANWSIHKEKFLANTTWINELRLRGSYGTNGTVPLSNAGKYLVLKRDANYYLDPSVWVNTILSPVNQDLRWEKVINYNAGLDFTFFNNRFWGTIDYYLKKSIDVFGEQSSDPTLGYNQYLSNTVSLRNRGVEISLNAINIQKENWVWQTQLTGAFNKNIVTAIETKLGGHERSLVEELSLIKGYPTAALFAYDYAGLDTLGRPQIFDKDGKKKILLETGGMATDLEKEERLADLKYMGTTLPKYTIGLNNQIAWKNIELSFLFTYYGGYVTRIQPPSPSYIQGNEARFISGYQNYWKKKGDELVTDIPGLPSYNGPGAFDQLTLNTYLYASKFVHRADHIRLSDVVLTYTLPFETVNKWRLSNVQLRFQAQNLFRYNLFGGDFDPDYMERRSGIRRLVEKPIFSFSLFTEF